VGIAHQSRGDEDEHRGGQWGHDHGDYKQAEGEVRRWLAIGAALIATGGLLVACSSPPKVSTTLTCQTPPTFTAGHTYRVHGCYTIPPKGVVISENDVKITGQSTWTDANIKGCPFNRCGPEDRFGRPAFKITGTGDTLNHLTVGGANKGGYHPKLAFNDGIDLVGSHSTTLTDDTVHNVFGTCLDITPYGFPTHGWQATTDLTVTGFTGTDCGLQGIALVSLEGGKFTDVTIGTTGQDPWDFEDDSLGEGARNVTVDSCSYRGLVNISAGGGSEGPITFTDCTSSGRTGDSLRVDNLTGKPMGLVNFVNDHLACAGSVYVACVNASGPDTVNITDSTISVHYRAEKLYTAIKDSSVEFWGVTTSGQFSAGTHDSTSIIEGTP